MSPGFDIAILIGLLLVALAVGGFGWIAWRMALVFLERAGADDPHDPPQLGGGR